MATVEEFNNLYIKAYNTEITFEEFLNEFNNLVQFECISESPVYFSTSYAHTREERLALKYTEELQEVVLKLVKEIELEEGNGGEKYYIIYHVIPYNRYIKQEGMYYSHIGVKVETPVYEVVPVKVESYEYVKK